MKNVVAAALIVAKLSATHPSAVKFNDQLKALAVARELLAHRLKVESDSILSTVRKEYRYECRSATSELYLPDAVREGGAIRVVRTWTNKAWYVEHAVTYGASCGSDEAESKCSVVYYRAKGMLLAHQGMGYMLLRPNQEVSDAEWDQVQAGHAPVRLLNV